MTRSRLARWTLLAVAFVVCCLAAAAVTVQTTWFHEWLRREAIARAAQWIDGELTIGSVTGNVFRGVTLHNVTIRRNGITVMGATTASVTYDIIGLLRGHLALDDLEVTKPALTITETRDGWTVDGIRSQSTGGSGAFALHHVTMTDGTIDVSGATARCRFVDLAAEGALTSNGSALDASIQHLTARDVTTGVQIQEFSAAATFTDKAVNVSRVVLKTPGSDVSGRGSYDRTTRAVDVAMTASPLSMTETAAYVRGLTGRTLAPSFDVQARGRLDSLHIQADARSSAGSLAADVVADLADASKTIKGIVDVHDLDLGPILDRRDLAGRVTGHGAINVTAPDGDLSRSTLTFDLTVPQVAVGAYRATTVRTTGTLRGGTVRGAIRGDAFGAHADLRGEWSGFSRSARSDMTRYTIAGRVSGVRPTDLGRSLKIAALTDQRLAGTVNVTLDVRGHGRTRDHQAMRAIMTMENSSVGGVTLPLAHIDATLTNRQLTAAVQGTFSNFDPRALGFSAPAATLTAGSVSGTVTVPDIRARIDVNTIAADVTLELAPSQVAGFAVDRGTVAGALANGVASIRQLDVAGPTGSVHVDGRLAFGDRDTSDLRYVVDVADLAPLAKATGYVMTGRAHADGTIAGPRDRIAVTGTLSAQQLTIGDTAVALTANSTLQATVPNWQLTGATGTAEGHATFVTFHGSDFQRVGVTATYDAAGLALKSQLDRADQQLTIDTLVQPRPEQHEIDVHRLAVSDTHATWQLAESDVVVRYSDSRISTTPATFTRGAEKIAVRGTLALQSEDVAASALDVTLAGIQLADLGSLVLDQHDLAGRLDATAHVTGTATAPVIRSHGDVTGGSVNGVPFEHLAADADYRSGRIGLNVDLQQNATQRLTATGTVPSDRHATGVDLDVRSDPIDVRLFQPLTSQVGLANGAVQFDAHVSGSLDAPSIRGNVSAAEVGFSVKPTGMSYQHLNGQIRFDAGTAHIERLTVEDDDRHVLTAQGDVQGWFGGAPSIGVRLTTTAFHLLRNDLGELGIDAAVDVSGSFEHPDVRGTVTTHTARLDLDAWREQFGAAPEDIAPEAATGSLLDKTSWHIDLDLADNVVVQGKPTGPAATAVSLGGLNATVGGTLTLTKAPEEDPAITGRLHVTRGTYLFQGRSFQIANDSEIRFQGRRPIDPDLSITAERDVDSVTVNVHVTGSARRPQVTLSSNPPLDQGDVLSLILFNQPINALGQSDRTVLADRAAAMATGVLTTPIAGAVAQALDLDLFEIRPAGDSSTGPSVAIGRQIGGNLFVRVQQALSDSQDSQLLIEYQFSKLLRLVTSVAQGAQASTLTRRAERSGIDLVFVIRF